MSDVSAFFAEFGPMFTKDPAHAILLSVVILLIGFFVGRWQARHLVEIANQRAAHFREQADWYKEKIVAQAPDREVELKRLDAQMLHDQRLLGKRSRQS